MDRKYNVDGEWNISKVVTLKDFLEEAWNSDVELRGVLNRPPPNQTNKETDYHSSQMMKDFLDIGGISCTSNTARKIFEDELSLSNLIGDPDMPTNRSWDENLSDHINLRPDVLRTHTYAKHNLEFCKHHQKKAEFFRRMKYDKYDRNAVGLERRRGEWYSVSDKDIVIFVSIVKPYNKILHQEKDNRDSRLMQVQTKYMLRGDSTLESLRKKLTCVSDMVVPLVPGREYEPPDMNLSAMVEYPSSFIFINDTFYVDFSMPGATDTSHPIREFMAKKKCFDPVSAFKMEGVKIIDLKLRLGMPYLFHHSGTCEHLLIFHDLRLLHKSDQQDISMYPMMAYERGGESKCAGCKINFATYQVLDCDRLPYPSMLFCDDCFREFNFSHNVKLGQFTAYPYFQTNRLAFI